MATTDVQTRTLPVERQADIAEYLRGELGNEKLLETLLGCMSATRVGAKGVIIEDYSTRLNAVQLAWAYMYGRPVERKLEARASAQQVAGGGGGGGVPLERLLAAPAAVDALLEALLASEGGRAAAQRLLAKGPAEGLVVEVEPAESAE